MERTENPYKTHGPDGDTGESWHEYFRRLRLEREAQQAQSDEDDDACVQLLVPGRLVRDDDPIPSGIRTWTKLLVRADWQVKIGYSKVLIPGKAFKSGEREGEVRADRTINQSWIEAHDSAGGRIRIAYQQPEGGKPVCLHRLWSGSYRKLSDAEMKEVINADAGS